MPGGTVSRTSNVKPDTDYFPLKAELRRNISLLQAEVQKKDGMLSVQHETYLLYTPWLSQRNIGGMTHQACLTWQS